MFRICFLCRCCDRAVVPEEPYLGPRMHPWEGVCRIADSEGGEMMHTNTWRMRVPGGWLYRYDGQSPVFVALPEEDRV